VAGARSAFRIGDEGELVPDEAEQAAVKRMVAMRKRGKSLRAIAAAMTAKGDKLVLSSAHCDWLNYPRQAVPAGRCQFNARAKPQTIEALYAIATGRDGFGETLERALGRPSA
jgi:hypothetical protein